MDIAAELQTKGYCVVSNILSNEEIYEAKQLFFKWQKTIPNHDKLHNAIDPHGIYKYHQIGHQEHAWYIRTRPKVQEVFKKIWNCEELVVSFDGSCYISKSLNKKDAIWTHTDQAPISKGLQCYQGFVALTSNKERTLVVYEGSHNYHEKYFEEKKNTSSKNWQLIDHETLQLMSVKKKSTRSTCGCVGTMGF